MAKMKTCKCCGAEVASSATVCPKCGAKLKRVWLRNFAIIFLLFCVAFLYILFFD